MNRVRIKPISKKRREQLRKEALLKIELLDRARGRCEKCGNLPDWRGLSKHEIKSRAQGGDPLDPDNCEMLCGGCHSLEHGIEEVQDGL